MKRVFVDAQRFGNEGDSVGIDPPLEATKGGVCPEFHYSYDTKRGIATCWHNRIEDEQQQMPSVPSTCKSGVMDKTCSLPDDHLPREPWAAQVREGYARRAGGGERGECGKAECGWGMTRLNCEMA